MRRLLACLMAVPLVTTACAHASSRTTMVLGALYPTSGPQAAGGTEEERGVRLAVEWADGHGGVRSRRVRLETVDAPRPEAVPSAMRELERRGARVVVGSHGSAVSAVAADVATREGMVLWETGAVGQTTDYVKGGRNFFRLAPMGANLGQAAISFVRDQLLPRLSARPRLWFGVAYVDDSYGRAVASGATREIRRRGLPLAGSFAYDAHRADFAAVAHEIGAAHVDVLFVSAYIDDGVALRRAVVDAHVPLVASIGTSSSYCMPAFGARLGPAAVGLFASDKPDGPDVNPAALTPEARRALAWAQARYQARWHDAMSAAALSGFSNTYGLLVHVLPGAASDTPGAVARAALATKLPVGALANGGGIDLEPPGAPNAGENRNAAGVIWEWIGPGQRAVVWPQAFATHPVVPLPLQ